MPCAGRRLACARRSAGRRRWARLLACLGAVLLAGCAGDARRDGLAPHEFATVDHIAVHLAGDGPSIAYQVLDRIEGTSCNLSGAPPHHPAHKVVTEYEALYDMKLEAADLGANAVVGVTCERYGVYRDCYQAVVCQGDAVALDDGVGMALPLASMSALQATARSADFAGNPALYESLVGFTPDYLTEAQRANLGKVGLATPARAPGQTIEEPPSGEEAVYQGAGLWFLQCAAQGSTIGLLVSPLCAALGAGLAALSAETEDNVQASGGAIRSALADAYSHEALGERIARVAAQSGAPLLEADAAARSQDSTGGRESPLRLGAGVDSIIEVGVEELLLPAWRSAATTNLPIPVSVRTRVRVVRLSDSREVYNRSYGFVSQKRLFREWGAENGAALRHALEAGFEHIAEKIVEDLLLAYPLMPGFAITNAATGRRNYIIEPLAPAVHAYWSQGAPRATPIDSLEPRLRWQPFPSAKVLLADFQSKLRRLSALRYELRIYRLDEQRRQARLVVERNNIEATEYQVEQPLAPGTEYAWSVRARFELDTGERTSRWSGDWVGGRVRGFLFRTPE